MEDLYGGFTHLPCYFLVFFRIPQLYMLSNTVGYNILNKICSFRFVNENSSSDSYWALGQLDFVSYMGRIRPFD